MLIPVSILWWQKCCYLLLCPCQVPPWLSVWLHKLKLYLHYLVRNFYSCTFGIDHYYMFCGGFWLTFFCVTVVLHCVMTCFLSSNKLKSSLDIAIFLSLRMLLCCCCRYLWKFLLIFKGGPLLCMCMISVMTCKFPNLCSISNTYLE